jgi:hypothetical protein
MNNLEIDRILSSKSDIFRGVYSSDTLPNNVHGLIVCNTDPHDRPGEHWVAMYVDEKCGEFFDSFGRPPTRVFKDFMNSNCKRWIFNDRQLQSICSRFCGHYCVYYCILRSRGIDMRKISRSLTTDTGFNDVLVHGFICQ